MWVSYLNDSPTLIGMWAGKNEGFQYAKIMEGPTCICIVYDGIIKVFSDQIAKAIHEYIYIIQNAINAGSANQEGPPTVPLSSFNSSVDPLRVPLISFDALQVTGEYPKPDYKRKIQSFG